MLKDNFIIPKNPKAYPDPTKEEHQAHDARAAAENRRELLREQREQADPWDDVRTTHG